MFPPCPAIKGRHGFGLLLILLLVVSPHVPTLSANPTGVRNFSSLAFDLTFIVPWLLAGWRRRPAGGGQTTTPAAPVGGIGLGAIALAGGGSFFACWLLGPAAQAGLLQWIVPGVTIAAGFICRWAAMSAEQAVWQCARNRSRFTGVEILRKVIDRGIIVLFWLTLPAAQAVGPDMDPDVAALAHQLTCLAVGARGGLLVMLGGTALDWALAETIAWRRRLAGSHVAPAAPIR
jgi:hypothetical protein